jgi:ketosteroid isomerase-like protein
MSNASTVSGLEEVADVIRRYFALDEARDIDSIVALFTEDATVTDEGETRHGTAQIRAWQTGPASQYKYTTAILGTDALAADRHVVTGRLTGNFPGGVAELRWDFTLRGERIKTLVIAP